MLAFSHQEHIESYYFVTRNQHFELPPLNQKESADVCVVGAVLLRFIYRVRTC